MIEQKLTVKDGAGLSHLEVPSSSFRRGQLSAGADAVLERLDGVGIVSVFLFGSRARGEHKPSSQTEVGLFFRDDVPLSKSKLDELIRPPADVDLFPYRLDDFRNHTLVIPFQRHLYLYEVISQGLTIKGEDLLKTCKPPAVTNLHLSQDIKFWQGRASDALVCHRAKSQQVADVLFSKAVFAGLRDLMILKQRIFPNTRSDLFVMTREFGDPSLIALCEAAEAARSGSEVPFDTLLAGVRFLTEVVEATILESLNHGEEILLGR